MRTLRLIPAPEDAGTRLDAWLAAHTELSRSRAAALLADGCITVNGAPAKASLRLSGGEVILCALPEAVPMEARPEAISLDIVYEDEAILIINKPRGMVVHPAAGNTTGTLVNALLYHCHNLSGIGGVLRPGIVHRIDKDTTGLLAVAKNDEAHRVLAAQLENRSMFRRYTALVEGALKPEEGEVEAPIGRNPADRKSMAVVQRGKPAVTHWQVLQRFPDYTLVACRLETGRTHQIRVHMKSLGHPVAGDPIYGSKKNPLRAPGQLLHAEKLTLRHPITGEQMTFQAPLPEDFRQILDALSRKAGFFAEKDPK
ncbi:MAG: RluA family pseudouridine synthase [Christensenellales bacterium]|jgi:23S rRNA pseudouridine1911/1915/1917 synthase